MKSIQDLVREAGVDTEEAVMLPVLLRRAEARAVLAAQKEKTK